MARRAVTRHFWERVIEKWKNGLSPERMEEICVAVESHLGEVGGVVYGSAPFKGRPSGAMIWRFPELADVSAKELERFSSCITPEMKERLVRAQQPTIDARKAERTANLARANLATAGQATA